LESDRSRLVCGGGGAVNDARVDVCGLDLLFELSIGGNGTSSLPAGVLLSSLRAKNTEIFVN
jgi:hypothetical protein